MKDTKNLVEDFQNSLFSLKRQAIEIPDEADIIAKKIAGILMQNCFVWRGHKWKINSVLDTVVACAEYDYSDLRSTDRVVDVGACVGAFSILSSKYVKEIFAIEPLFGDLLLENLVLNGVQNVHLFELAIGEEEGYTILRYDPRINITRVVTFKKLMEIIGPADFLKFDAEMAEWNLSYEDFINFRRVEIEVHNHDGKHGITEYEKKIEDAGFEYFTTKIPDSVVHIIHGFK